MKWKWIDLGKQQPNRGQRCVVWDIEERDSYFAVWDAEDRRFYEVPSYHGHRLIACRWWMPEPEIPEEHA